MNRNKLLQLFILTLFLTACRVNSKHWSEKTERMEKCKNNWTYKDLPQTMELNVLLFNKKFRFDLSSFPNFIIGVTPSSDTIGIIDNNFEGTINTNERITVLPSVWTEMEKSFSKPAFIVYKKSKLIDLHCSVRTVYYAKINKE